MWGHTSEIWDIKHDVIFCYRILILIFFCLVNLRTRIDEILGRMFDSQSFGEKFADYIEKI